MMRVWVVILNIVIIFLSSINALQAAGAQTFVYKMEGGKYRLYVNNELNSGYGTAGVGCRLAPKNVNIIECFVFHKKDNNFSCAVISFDHTGAYLKPDVAGFTQEVGGGWYNFTDGIKLNMQSPNACGDIDVAGSFGNAIYKTLIEPIPGPPPVGYR